MDSFQKTRAVCRPERRVPIHTRSPLPAEAATHEVVIKLCDMIHIVFVVVRSLRDIIEQHILLHKLQEN